MSNTPLPNLSSFGFPPELVELALQENGFDYEKALNWILEQKEVQKHPYLSEQGSQINEFEHSDLTRMLSADSKDKLLLFKALNPDTSHQNAQTLLENIARAHQEKKITDEEKAQLHILMIEQSNIESTQHQLDQLKKQHDERLQKERREENPVAQFTQAHHPIFGPNRFFPLPFPLPFPFSFPISHLNSDEMYQHEQTAHQESEHNENQHDYRDVIADQDQEYYEALLKDQEMDRQKEEELKQKQEEEIRYQQEQEQLIENRNREIERKKRKFLEEPENSVDQTIRIRFQLPNLPHVDRRFSSSSPLQDIFDFIDLTLYEHQIDSKFEVIMFPKRILTEDIRDKTLRELEIVGSVVLRITLKE